MSPINAFPGRSLQMMASLVLLPAAPFLPGARIPARSPPKEKQLLSSSGSLTLSGRRGHVGHGLQKPLPTPPPGVP